MHVCMWLVWQPLHCFAACTCYFLSHAPASDCLCLLSHHFVFCTRSLSLCLTRSGAWSTCCCAARSALCQRRFGLTLVCGATSVLKRNASAAHDADCSLARSFAHYVIRPLRRDVVVVVDLKFRTYRCGCCALVVVANFAVTQFFFFIFVDLVFSCCHLFNTSARNCCCFSFLSDSHCC